MVKAFVCALCALVGFAAALAAAEEDALVNDLGKALMPANWKQVGDAKVYDRTNLYELVDGEAELYLPYGFKRVIALEYGVPDKPAEGVAVEVYELGSILDAFGVYSNCRDADSKLLTIGTEGIAGNTQIMFYQERFFVKVRTRGASVENRASLLPCAQVVSGKLPKNTAAPEELAMLDIASVIPKTQQYFAQSVMGYDFFTNGFTAEFTLRDLRVKAFIVTEISPKTARLALGRYEDYLKSSKANYSWRQIARGKALVAKDPLYKGVIVRQLGSMLVGIAKLDDCEKGFALLDQLYTRAAESARKEMSRGTPVEPPPAPAK